MFCDDLSQLVLDVMAHRGLDPHSCDVHCGFDGGQGMLKLAVTVTDRLESKESGRSHYSQVIVFLTAQWGDMSLSADIQKHSSSLSVLAENFRKLAEIQMF